jgi:K+-transporting ATPase ATPase C chain
MKTPFPELFRAARITLLLATVTCGLYPIMVTVAARLFFQDKAHGSLLRDGTGSIRSSILLGQAFNEPDCFHPRPSATGYIAADSGGHNLGPTSLKLRDLLRQRIIDYRTLNGLAADAEVPADAVTASASGLDPHISLHNAACQPPRVARARGVPVETVRQLVRKHTESPPLLLFGPPGVHVLKLNLALEELP